MTVANREVVTAGFARDSIAVVDDDELLSRARRDPEAFGAFYERHERLVLGFFMRRTRDPELAADLAAETFAVALVAARKYRGGEGAPASAWLVGIARHTLFASLRRSRVEDRARRRLGMEPIELDDELLSRIERLGGDSRVESLLGRLTPEQSDAVRARVVEEEEYAEIALRLRCSESVIRQRVHRGLSVLRRIYEEEAS
jgi:RNA polymerase sigma factor (sigma-70 family)